MGCGCGGRGGGLGVMVRLVGDGGGLGTCSMALFRGLFGVY